MGKMARDENKVLVERIFEHVRNNLDSVTHRIPGECLFPDFDARDEKASKDAVRRLISVNSEMRGARGFQVVGLITKVEYFENEGMFEIVLSRDADKVFEFCLGKGCG